MTNYQIDENLTFKHYKEPLKPIPKGKGFGFYGAILMTKDMDKIQCHECGETHRTLAGHLRAAHNTTAEKYREKFDLARTTALVSESMRFQLKNAQLEYLKTLTPQEKDELQRKAREQAALKGYNNTEFKIRLETKNKRGTCPDQLLDQIVKVAQKLGRTPTKPEFIEATGTQRYVHLIYKTFGSWKYAIELTGLEKHVPKKGGFPGYTSEQLIDALKRYYEEYKTIPGESDFKRGFLPAATVYRKHFGTIVDARDIAGIPQPMRSVKWTKENLIQALKDWAKEHGRVPSHKDFGGKGGLPFRGTYEKHFGGIQEARELAGLTRDLRGINKKPELGKLNVA